MARFRELAGPLTAAAMESDGAAYVDFLAKQAGVSAGKMGVVGYCFTAAMAMRTAAARPERIAAVAGFHGGRLFTDDPASPHTILPRIKARLYFGHAIEDHSMPKEAIEKFEQALRAWGGKFESETYRGRASRLDAAGYACLQRAASGAGVRETDRAFRRHAEMKESQRHSVDEVCNPKLPTESHGLHQILMKMF